MPTFRFGGYGNSLKNLYTSYVTLSAKSSLILGENKAVFCRECHIYAEIEVHGNGEHMLM